MSSFGIVTTINALQLGSVAQPNLFRFEVEYSAYHQKCEDINRNRAEDNQIEIASIRQCLRPVLLHSLCIVGKIEGAATLEQATDENVKHWFDARLDPSSKDISERVTTAIGSIQHNPCNNNLSRATMDFV